METICREEYGISGSINSGLFYFPDFREWFRWPSVMIKKVEKQIPGSAHLSGSTLPQNWMEMVLIILLINKQTMKTYLLGGGHEVFCNELWELTVEIQTKHKKHRKNDSSWITEQTLYLNPTLTWSPIFCSYVGVWVSDHLSSSHIHNSCSKGFKSFEWKRLKLKNERKEKYSIYTYNKTKSRKK